MNLSRFSLFVAFLSICLGSTSCTNSIAGESPAHRQRAAEIASEPRGEYWIGRRYFVEKTRFWGYLRRPGTSWDDAKLVVMNEIRQSVPDRLPEADFGTPDAFGYDHNYEYKVFGKFSGQTIYDPNSNLFLPEFIPESFEVRSKSPGWLFDPKEQYNPTEMPPKRS